jgi:uncharacterized protein
VAWTVLGVLALVLLADLLLRLAYVRVILPQFETKPPFNARLFPVDPDAESVTFLSDDGVELAGALWWPADDVPRGLVVFCHELDSHRWSAAHYAAGLLTAGFAVFSFDFRNHGDSGSQPGYSPLHWPTHGEVDDLRAALKYLDTRPELMGVPRGVFGVSRGSLVALIVAAESPRITAVCGEGTYTIDSLMEHFVVRWARLYLPDWVLAVLPLWHIRGTIRLARWCSAVQRGVRYAIVEPSLARLRLCSVMLIAGERDNYVKPQITREICRKLDSPFAEVWEVAGAKHNEGRMMGRAEYDRRVVAFFSVLGPRRSAAVIPIASAAS